MILGGVAAKGAHTEHKGCRRNSKLFEKAGKLCLCGLQGINDWVGYRPIPRFFFFFSAQDEQRAVWPGKEHVYA